jgi:hypothetical protein
MSDLDDSDTLSLPDVIVKRPKQIKVSIGKAIIEEHNEKRKPGRPPKNDKYKPPE